jgi:tetrapyrrole methylase family protein/MazG family protein
MDLAALPDGYSFGQMTPGELPVVHVVGLGPAGPDLVTAGTLELVGRVPVRYLRTVRHPAASVLEGAPSFDHHYETAERIEDVYAAVVEDLVAAAAVHGEEIGRAHV